MFIMMAGYDLWLQIKTEQAAQCCFEVRYIIYISISDLSMLVD